MKVFDFPQYSPDWWEIRRGVPTASDADKIITPKTGKMSAQADKYICRLIADKVRFDPNMITEGPSTPAMRNGSMVEPDARRWYEFQNDLAVRQVGFCLTDDDRFGCSPDGLVGDEGLLELKCPNPDTHVGYLLGGDLPNDYRPQCHFQLIVTGREWVDFLSYCAGFDPFICRVEPDEFTDTLRGVMEEFYAKYQKCLEQFETTLNQAPARQQFEVPEWLQDPKEVPV